MSEPDHDEVDDSEYKNLCVACGIDMGPQNPRQFCGKTYCLEKGYDWEPQEHEEIQEIDSQKTEEMEPSPERETIIIDSSQ